MFREPTESRARHRPGGHRALILVVVNLVFVSPLIIEACLASPVDRPAEVVESVYAEGEGVTVRMPTMTYHCTGTWRALCKGVEAGDNIALQVERDPSYRLTIRPASGRWRMVANRQRVEFLEPGRTVSFPLEARAETCPAGLELRRRLGAEVKP